MSVRDGWLGFTLIKGSMNGVFLSIVFLLLRGSHKVGNRPYTGEKEKKRKEGEKEARRVARSFKTSPIVVVAQRRSTSTYCG